MPLSTGDRLGPYEVTGELGAGGMGVVLRARDTKLDRQVALKLLPEAFADDPDRLARFQREAQVLATLNHPNIGQIYGLEEAPSARSASSGSRGSGQATERALVLELVEGPTLADRIAEGPMPVDEALSVATQIAEALEAAHDAGVIHRDLKPANIKVREDGTVKVLDFGLAKALVPDAGGESAVAPDQSPTLTAAATRMGVILGTAAYMSPEQARGKAVDTRSDVWAFGVVLFEMLTGRRAFEGEDASLTMSAVLQREPDWTVLPADLAPRVRTVLERCLQKDPKQRLQAIGDVRLALAGAFDVPAGPLTESAASDRSRGVSWTAMGIAVVLFLAAGTLGTRWLGPDDQRVESAPTRYLELVLDPAPVLVFGSPPVLSPDGRFIAYVGASETQPWRLYVRDLADGSTRPVPGSERAQGASFDPLGRAVTYVADGGLWVWGIGGALPERIATIAGGGQGTAWLSDGTIVVSAAGYPHPRRFSAADGAPVPLEIQAEGADELAVSHPVGLPDTDTVLVSTLGPATDGPRVAALSLTEGTLTPIVEGSNPHFVAPSTLVFMQQGALVAAPFDLAALALTGSPRTLSPAGTVTTTLSENAGDLLMGSLSPSGFALLPMDVASPGRLVWVDPGGRETPTGFEFGGSVGPLDLTNVSRSSGVSLSPGGDRAAVLIGGPVVVDLGDVSGPQPLGFFSAAMAYPRWEPGEEHLVVTSGHTGPLHGFRFATSGGSEPEPFTEQPQSVPTSFLPGGESMLGYVVADETQRDLWVFHLDGPDEPLLQTAANERGPTVAPDGRTYAYVSDTSGADRIYLQRYPDGGQPQPISGDGATGPVWSRDGRELFFVADGRLMAVEVDLSDQVLRSSPPRELFPVGLYDVNDINGNSLYDVAEDGRFLMTRPAAGSRTWRFIQNWGTELDALLAREQ